jgi:hypothetical protein
MRLATEHNTIGIGHNSIIHSSRRWSFYCAILGAAEEETCIVVSTALGSRRPTSEVDCEAPSWRLLPSLRYRRLLSSNSEVSIPYHL